MLGVPLSGPLENVEIYFSKIDREIYASDTIFFIAESFYTNKMRIFAKTNRQIIVNTKIRHSLKNTENRV